MRCQTRLVDSPEVLRKRSISLGAICVRLAKRGQGHRCLIVGRFKIVYFVEGDPIHVTDFFDTKQHPSRMRG